MKALQVPLSPRPTQWNADENGILRGFGIPLNFQTGEFVGGGRQPGLFKGSTVGTMLAPNQPHEGNHGEECRKDHAGLPTCRQL